MRVARSLAFATWTFAKEAKKKKRYNVHLFFFFQNDPWSKKPSYIVETPFVFVLAALAVKVLRLTFAGDARTIGRTY